MSGDESLKDAPTTDRCPACGAKPVEGFDSCQAMWDHLLAETFSNFRYGRFHRLIVDLYSLQHPDQYCASAKSYAAHLTGLCCHLEHDADPSVNSALQSWLNGPRDDLEKPPVPAYRGQLTIVHVVGAGESEVATRVEEWCREVWSAYAELHDVARGWIDDASG